FLELLAHQRCSQPWRSFRHAVDQLAFLADLSALAFFAPALCGTALFATAFLAGAFLAADFLGEAFLAGVFLAPVPCRAARFCSTLRRSASIRSMTSPRSASSSSCSPKVAAVSTASPFSSFA